MFFLACQSIPIGGGSHRLVVTTVRTTTQSAIPILEMGVHVNGLVLSRGVEVAIGVGADAVEQRVTQITLGASAIGCLLVVETLAGLDGQIGEVVLEALAEVYSGEGPVRCLLAEVGTPREEPRLWGHDVRLVVARVQKQQDSRPAVPVRLANAGERVVEGVTSLVGSAFATVVAGS